MRQPRPARVQPNSPGGSQKHDGVRMRGAAILGAQRNSGRSCACSRPMRIFPIAFGNYDAAISKRHARGEDRRRSVAFRRRSAERVSAPAQRCDNFGVRKTLRRSVCAIPARDCINLDQDSSLVDARGDTLYHSPLRRHAFMPSDASLAHHPGMHRTLCDARVLALHLHAAQA